MTDDLRKKAEECMAMFSCKDQGCHMCVSMTNVIESKLLAVQNETWEKAAEIAERVACNLVEATEQGGHIQKEVGLVISDAIREECSRL